MEVEERKLVKHEWAGEVVQERNEGTLVPLTSLIPPTHNTSFVGMGACKWRVGKQQETVKVQATRREWAGWVEGDRRVMTQHQ